MDHIALRLAQEYVDNYEFVTIEELVQETLDKLPENTIIAYALDYNKLLDLVWLNLVTEWDLPTDLSFFAWNELKEERASSEAAALLIA